MVDNLCVLITYRFYSFHEFVSMFSKICFNIFNYVWGPLLVKHWNYNLIWRRCSDFHCYRKFSMDGLEPTAGQQVLYHAEQLPRLQFSHSLNASWKIKLTGSTLVLHWSHGVESFLSSWHTLRHYLNIRRITESDMSFLFHQDLITRTRHEEHLFRLSRHCAWIWTVWLGGLFA
jgi:hypothetical protein